MLSLWSFGTFKCLQRYPINRTSRCYPLAILSSHGGTNHDPLIQTTRLVHNEHDTTAGPSYLYRMAVATSLFFGLSWCWWKSSLDEKSKSFRTFPISAHCAEKVRSQVSKERLAAIHALDVVAEVAQEVQPAVVSITSRDKGFLSRHVQSTGSGFIIDNEGHVITNAHVVGYRSDVFIHLSDGRSYPGRVLAVDVSSDLALVQLDIKAETARSLPKLPLAIDLKSVRPGQFVLALGSPLMLANSVTVGVVSAVDRDLGHSEGLKYIQTDAIITVGNSGGPLVNLYGEVIGVNSMIAGIGVGFAIPVEQVRKFSELAIRAACQTDKPARGGLNESGSSYILTESGSPPSGAPQRRYLGLVMRTLTPELAFELASRGGPQFMEVTEGVLIHAILRNSPAQRAGLKAGDVIIAIDGLPITNAQQVYAAAENRDELTITIIRRGQRLTISGVRTEKV